MNNKLHISNLTILCSEVYNTFYMFSSTPMIDEVSTTYNTELYRQGSVVFLGKSAIHYEDVLNAQSEQVFTIALINSEDVHIVFNKINKAQALWIINNYNTNDIMFVFKSDDAISVNEYLKKLTIEHLSSIYNSDVAYSIVSFGADLFESIEVKNNLIMVTYINNQGVELYNTEEFLHTLIGAGNSLIEAGDSSLIPVIKSCISVIKEYLQTQVKVLFDYYNNYFGEYIWRTLSDWITLNDLRLKEPEDSFITVANEAELLRYSFYTPEEFLIFVLKDCRKCIEKGNCIIDYSAILSELMFRQFSSFDERFGKESWTDISNMLGSQGTALIMDNDKLVILSTSDLSTQEVDESYLLHISRKTKESPEKELVKTGHVINRIYGTSSKLQTQDKAFRHVDFAKYIHIDVANILNKYIKNVYVDPFNQLYKIIPGTDNVLISAVPITFKDVLKEVFDTLYELKTQASNDISMNKMVIEELEILSQYI